MKKSIKTILLVDDEEKLLHSIAQRLELMGFSSLKATSGLEAIDLARSNYIDLAIVDLKMPGMDGLVTIAKLKEIYPELKTILLTGHGNEKIKQATEKLDAAYFEKDEMGGFWDFIRKINTDGNIIVIRPSGAGNGSDNRGIDSRQGFGPGQIEIVTNANTSGNYQNFREVSDRSEDTPVPQRSRMIGETQAMQDLRRNIERLAALDCTVIIRGETGTGKELAARAIHELSARRNNRFLAINCGCFSSEQIFGELLGSEKNIPGQANEPGKNILGLKAEGTILLDQIEDMSQKMQMEFLRIIDTGTVTRKDGNLQIPIDVRIIVATHLNLRKLVEDGKFREDLYYRLNVFELFIPPLRDRRDDIPPLSSFFLQKISQDFNKKVQKISDPVMSIFMRYEFPGNVRELEHIIERAVILADGTTIEPRHLPQRFRTAASTKALREGQYETLAEKEKKYIIEVLVATENNKSRAAEILGISRAALWRKLKQFKEDDKS